METTQITVEALIDAPIETVWEKWTSPEAICQWNNASDDWHTTKAEIDLQAGGKFSSRMEAKDGSMGFDFGGVYDIVKQHDYLECTLGDGRKMMTSFVAEDGKTKVVETFDAESVNSIDLQRMGWQAILDNFKRYVETL